MTYQHPVDSLPYSYRQVSPRWYTDPATGRVWYIDEFGRPIPWSHPSNFDLDRHALQTQYRAGGFPSRVITRPPFHHGRHLVLSAVTLGMWLPVYAAAYAWHRFGPTKAVSTWR